MKETQIYGASDDCIEVIGEDEWYARGDEKPDYIVFSTGDVFAIRYGADALPIWEIQHIEDTGKLKVSIDRCERIDEADPYTDLADVSGEWDWVDCWPTWPPTEADVRERMDSQDLWGEITGEALMAAYRSATGRG